MIVAAFIVIAVVAVIVPWIAVTIRRIDDDDAFIDRLTDTEGDG